MAGENEKLCALLKRFDTAMLATHKGGARMHVRPMAIARVDPDCVTWFFTSKESPKVFELDNDDRVQVICQDDDTFVSIAGAAQLSDDRAKIDELWSEPLHAWFPNGKDDPNLVLITVSPLEGEYWDSKGVKGVSYAFEAVKAAVKNVATDEKQTPAIGREQHGKATF